jgi:hypothetical protein
MIIKHLFFAHHLYNEGLGSIYRLTIYGGYMAGKQSRSRISDIR